MIQIQVTGTLKIDDSTIVKNPLVTVESCLDDYIGSTVSVNSTFTNDNYAYGRNCGSFPYIETWTDKDVEDYMNLWIDEHRITV